MNIISSSIAQKHAELDNWCSMLVLDPSIDDCKISLSSSDIHVGSYTIISSGVTMTWLNAGLNEYHDGLW